MNALPEDQATPEGRVLTGLFGAAASNREALVAEQAAEIERLQAEMMCMRGEMIVQRTVLAFAEEERAALEAAAPDLPRRFALARRVDSLVARMQDLMRERGVSRSPARPRALGGVLPGLSGKAVLCLGRSEGEVEAARAMIERSGGAFTLHPPPASARDYGAFEACLAAADLVVCQISQVGLEVCRRVQEYCLRAGKHCLLVGGAAPALPALPAGASA